MNTTRIAATVIGSLAAMTLFEAVIKPRISAAQSRSSSTEAAAGDGWWWSQ